MNMLSETLLTRRVLHLGSGMKYSSDAINVDLVEVTYPDVIHNLDVSPWPLPDRHFREVWAYDVIEHLTDVVRTMDEIHRVCVNGAVVKITVPHFSCSNAFTDPTHRHYFGRFSFDCFTGENDLGFYSQARFRCITSQIIFRGGICNKLIRRLANRYPAWYESRWTWVFPAWFLYFELEVIKG
jgi:hypothetical protein